MDPLTLYGLGTTAAGLIGKVFNDTPDFTRLQGDYGAHGDYEYGASTNFGQGTAQENMNRYGFQGIYQNYLKSETERMKDDEMRRIQKLASSLAPGQASLRGGLASQGLGGSTSNVMARQQRQQGLGQALNSADQMFESRVGSLDNQLLQMTGQNEQLRFGASQDYMKSLGMESEATNQSRQFNANSRFREDSFNADQMFKRDSFNSQGEFQQGQMEYSKWNDIFGDVAGIGASMFGEGMSREFPKTGPYSKENPSGLGVGGRWAWPKMPGRP